MLQFLKQFFIYGFAAVLGKIAAVFLLPFYTNVLSQDEYGAMAMILAAGGIIGLFSNLNIHSGVARDYYEEAINRTKLISTGFYSIIFFSIIVFVILYISRNFWIENILNVGEHEEAFVVMLLTIPAGSLLSYFAVLTRYKQKAVLYSIGSILQLFIQISLTIYLVLIIKTGIAGVFYGILAGEGMGILFFYFINREHIALNFDRKSLKRILVFSLPTLPAILAGWLDSSLGQIIIGNVVSVKDAGIYAVALQISSVFLLINVAFSNVWYPYLYENIKKNNFHEEINRLFKLIVFILAILAVNVSLLSDEIILLLSNVNYSEAGRYLIILTIPMSLTILNWFSIMGPNISRNTKYISYATVAGSILNIALIIILLPVYGVIIVPIALGISRITSYFISSYYTKKEIQINLPVKPILMLVVGVLICFFIKQSVLHKYIHWLVLGIFNAVAMFYFYKTNNLTNYLHNLIFLRK
ncbi:MAG TPA: oligosaccharide flippase family protein [Smithellaceae bacterium]|nr:oligosaccharide flippase family protein [Smithellaceae bacterium]